MAAPQPTFDVAAPRDLRLMANVVLGALVGAVYVVFDILAESRIESGTLHGTLAGVHAVVDHTFPILVGGLLGLSAHYLRVRTQLAQAREAASRAEALRERLQKVERDQAVWVLAAAVLHELNNPLHALGLLLDEPEFERVALDAVVRAFANDVGSLAREDGLTVKLECEGAVLANADPTYVRTILENLVDNCLHSLRTQGRGSITIRLAVEAGRAVVRVLDDGPPFARGALDALFEPLRTTKTEGLGLGLPIARALARAMRGDLSLDDAATKSFRLELPLSVGGAP